MWKNLLSPCKNKSGFQQNINMEKIFFPLSGVAFSELCKIFISLRHVFVSGVVKRNHFNKAIFLTQFSDSSLYCDL